MTDVVPPDAEQRRRIADDLDSTLFVVAGAGSGKTTALVRRVLALVETGAAELGQIAAITFTEKAATELRDRVRSELERALATDLAPEPAERYRLALGQLDGAAIGTLHSFAQRILSEHPIEAGLPPRVEVVDEVSSAVAFERRWWTFRDELLADPGLERTVVLLTAAGVKFESLRTVAVAFNDNWDLVEERVPARAADPPDAVGLLAPVLTEIDRICAEPCRDPDDTLYRFLRPVVDYAAWLRTITDEVDLLEALDPDGPTKPPSFRAGSRGKQQSWTGNPAQVRSDLSAAGDRLGDLRGTVANACVKRLGSELRRFTLEAARERREAGQLEFHDLLVRARALLPRPGERRGRSSGAARALPTAAARRVPGHRSHSGGVGRAHRRHTGPAGHGRGPLDVARGRPRTPLLRRRPEAVDLPFPTGRHRHLPLGRGAVRGRRRRHGAAHRQLPGDGTRH